MNNQDKYHYLVRVSCMTYNHAHYIEDAMNGFCMQETSFPFVCTIIDDASIDGEPDVINKYLQEYFDLEDVSTVRNEESDDYVMIFARHKTNKNCHFAVFLLKYNHYQKKPKAPYISEWTDYTKYTALCEGDDYWIDSRKLQIQVDFLEAHSDYTMVCNRSQLYSERDKLMIGEQYCRCGNGELSPIDIINRTGLYIPTCSIIYRQNIRENDNYPSYCQNCNVGDYPLQISAAMKGLVFYFDDIMSVYRVNHPSSWTSHQKFKTIDPARIHIVKSQMLMFKGFSEDFPQYKDIFSNKIQEHICKNMPMWRNSSWGERLQYKGYFSKEIKSFRFKWKICFWLYFLPVPKLRFYIDKHFMKNYYTLKTSYKFDNEA